MVRLHCKSSYKRKCDKRIIRNSGTLIFYPFRTFEMYFAFIYDEVKKGIISV